MLYKARFFAGYCITGNPLCSQKVYNSSLDKQFSHEYNKNIINFKCDEGK